MLTLYRSNSPAVRAGYLALAALSAGFLAWNAWPNANYYPVDFKYFWLAGTLWNAGISPYGPDLLALGAIEFPNDRINPFFYPPNWRAIAGGVALATPKQAETLWAAASAGALMLASWQLALLSQRFAASQSAPRMFAIYFFLIACVAHGGEIAILIGQPTPFILVALTTLLFSIDRSDAWLATIAMTALFLKPQLSIPIAAAAMFVPLLRTPTIIAGGITGLLALFGLGLQASTETFFAFLSNLETYKIFPENWPIHMSGPNFLLALVDADAINAFALLGACIVLAIGGAVFLLRQRIELQQRDNALALLLYASLCAAFLMPTHNSDFLAAMPAILLVMRCSGIARILLLLGLFLLMRSMSLSVLTEGIIFVEKTSMVGLLDTIGSGMLFIAAGMTLLNLGKQAEYTNSMIICPGERRKACIDQ